MQNIPLNTDTHEALSFEDLGKLEFTSDSIQVPGSDADDIVTKSINGLLAFMAERNTATLSELVEALLNNNLITPYELELYGTDIFEPMVRTVHPGLKVHDMDLGENLEDFFREKTFEVGVGVNVKSQILTGLYDSLGLSLGFNASPLTSTHIYAAIANLDLMSISEKYLISIGQLNKILCEALYQFEVYKIDGAWKHIPLGLNLNHPDGLENLRSTNISIINKLNPYLHELLISNEAKMAIRRFCRLHPESIDQITSYQLEITEDKEKGTVNIGPNVLVMRTMKQVNYELIDESDLSRAQKSFITLLWEMSITLDLKNIFLNGQNLIKSIHRDEASQSGIGIQKVYETNQPLWQSDFSTSDLYRYINSFNVIENGDPDSVGLLRLKDLILDSSKILTDMYQVDIHTILDLIQNKLKEHN